MVAGLFGLSINPGEYNDSKNCFLDDLFWGTFYLQHLGEEYSGLATWREGKILVRTHRGHFRNAFKNDLAGLDGTEGIGFCGPDREPYFSTSRLGELTLCFSGNIINRQELVERFENLGHTFEGRGDIEIIAKSIAQGQDIVDGIKKMGREIEGAYSLLILSKEGIYAVCCPEGRWPLIIGQKEGAVVIASESGSFSKLGFKRIRDLEPGEIVLVKNGGSETKDKIPGERIQLCSFYYVYTGFPNDIIRGIPISLVRKRLGAALASRDIEKGFFPDIVAPVPDSGRSHAIGYHQEFCRQVNEGRIKKIPLYDENLLKYPYAGRSFTPQSQEARDQEAWVKILASGEDFSGLVGVVCDDSIVRGTQIKRDLVPELRKIGIKEIHFRISNPELRSHCPWGKTTKPGELFARRLPVKEERIKSLRIDGLEYNTIADLVLAIGLEKQQLCVDCCLD